MAHPETAVARFQSGFCCSQAILSTFAPPLGLDERTALRIASAFGGGMERMAETCGAVTGALMVLGLRHGSSDAADDRAKQRVHEEVRRFAALFRERNGSLACKELLGCDISTPEGYNRARNDGLIASRCPKLVRDSAEILDQML